MPKKSKRYQTAKDKLEPNKIYDASDAVALVKEMATAKFDETVEAHFRLGIDPNKSDQTVRGTVTLPHGTGRTIRVLAITQGDNIQAAQDAGADFVGGEDMIEKIQGGWLDFDAVVASPDMMAMVGSKLARILGPKGMLPNPKSGTVGPNVGEMVSALKQGKIEFRNDKTGTLHAPIGKASFSDTQLQENFAALRKAVETSKPTASKGIFLRSVYLTSTMGPSIPVVA